jgi:hypothetical protein
MLACVQSITELQHTFLYFCAHVQMQYCGKHLSPYVVSTLLYMWLVCHFQLSEIELNFVSVALHIIPHDVMCVYLSTHIYTIYTACMWVLEYEQKHTNKHVI